MTNRFPRLNTTLTALSVVTGLMFCNHILAQVVRPAASSVAPVATPKVKPVAELTISNTFTALDWKSLTPAQKIALAPLATQWAGMRDLQKRKWLSVSANFSKMSPAEQGRLHERMVQWAELSIKQHQQARLNFAEIQKITPQQKSEQWQAYQALSPEDKQRLAKSAQPKPPATALAPKPDLSTHVTKPSPKAKVASNVSAASAPAAVTRPAPPTSAAVSAAAQSTVH